MTKKFYVFVLTGLVLSILIHECDLARQAKSKRPTKHQNVITTLSGKNSEDEMFQEFLRDRMNRYSNSKAYSLLTRIGKR